MDEGFYDEATRRRIDGAVAASARPRARPRARFAGTVTFVTAIGLGLQQVLDAPDDEEIVLELDTSGLGRDDDPVTFDHDPTSVRRSRAHVRPWLLVGSPVGSPMGSPMGSPIR